MSRSTLLPTLTITAIALISLSACGGNEKEVSFKSAGVTHTFTEGAAVQTNKFPLPIYPKSQSSGSVATKSEGDDHSSFMLLSSEDPIDLIHSFYSKKLVEDGWTITSTTNTPKMINISASKKELEGNIMLNSDSAATTITLAVSREPEGTPEVTDKNYVPDKYNPPTD